MTDSRPVVRPVRPQDVPAVVSMVHELAAFERAPEQCHLTDAQLHAALFAPQPALFGHVVADPPAGPAADADNEWTEPFGFALWFLNYSTWDGVHGIYLEDLYVRPHRRGEGAGRALLATLAEVCVSRSYSRLQWWVLDWNEPALRFYEGLGAAPMHEWTVHRVTGPALITLGTRAPHRSPALASTEPDCAGLARTEPDPAELAVGERVSGEPRSRPTGSSPPAPGVSASGEAASR